MKRFPFVIFLATPLFCFCAHSNSVGNIPVEEIDFSSFIEQPFSSFLSNHQDNLSSLRLDSSPQYRLDMVDRAHFSDTEILLRDARMRKLVVISKMDGRVLSMVGHYGRARNEFLQISGFDRDDDNNIWILDARSKRILLFDGSTYEFVSSLTLDDNPVDVRCLSDDSFLFYLYPLGSRRAYQLCRLSNQKEKATYLPMGKNRDPNSIFSTQSFSPANDDDFYSCDIFIDDYVTLLDKSGQLLKQYKLDFGKYRIPDDIRSSVSKHAKELTRYRSACAPFFITPNWIGGRLFNKTAMSYFICNRDEKIMYIPDSDYEQMSLIHCDNHSMSFFLNTEIDNAIIKAICPDIQNTDYILTINLD
jgi:hypothetical protein